jgi:transposase
MLLSEGQMSDYKGAALMLDALPSAKALLGDRGYDADWLRQALATRGITACIPSKVNRKRAIPHDAALYRRRHKIEVMFGRLKDWRRIHTRYDRCAHTFMSAIAIAATVIFWLGQRVLSLISRQQQFSSRQCGCGCRFMSLQPSHGQCALIKVVMKPGLV